MYPRLKFVDTATLNEQITHIKEELDEFVEAVESDKLFEAIEEGHDICQSVTTAIYMLCESLGIHYEDSYRKCIKKCLERDGRRSERRQKELKE